MKQNVKQNNPEKNLLIILGFCLLLTAIIGSIYIARTTMAANTKQVKTICQELSVDIQSVKHAQTDIYTEKYQAEADEQIDTLKKAGEYTPTAPLVIENPYGTNTTSLYYYTKTDEPTYAKCRIVADGSSILEHTLATDDSQKYVTEHAYQLIGLVPGKKNYIYMEFYNENKVLLAKTQFCYTPAADDQIPQVESAQYGNSSAALSDGLFALLGHDKSTAANIYLFDNEGVSRGRIPLNGYRTDRLLFIGDQMVYSYDLNKIAFVNRLGRVEKTIVIPDYEFHHDFIYDQKQNAILALANKNGADTIEDRLIRIDCETGTVTELIDFKKLMPEFRASAVQRDGGKNTYGGTELDWIHFNSLDIISDGEIILSSREHSSLIKISKLYDSPQIDYIIHGGSLYTGTKYASLQLKKVGDFIGQAGQHTITVETDSSLSAHQYYLYMFNNNFGNAATIPSFDWSLYPGVGTFAKGEHSYYYKYLVDEKKGTYELVQSFALPYSSIVSSVEQIGGNIAFSSGMSKCFGEYDSDGNMIRTFYYNANKYSYRILKYDFKGFYYR